MPNYSPELVESALHRYVHTNDPVWQIAAEHGVTERDITRMRHDNGIPARGARIRTLPAGMRPLPDRRTQLNAAVPPHDASSASPRDAPPAPPHAAPPAAPDDEPPAPFSATPAQEDRPFSDGSVIERIERLIERELAAQETKRAELGSRARTMTEAESCARTIANMTRSLHMLMRLRSGRAPEQGPNDAGGMTGDADEIRDELARRIEALLASWEAEAGADGAT